MSFAIGDPIFDTQGRPGIVKDFQQDKTQLVINKETDSVKKSLRHGYLSGISNRELFNNIMDKISGEENPETKLKMLQAKIDELEADVSKENAQLLPYLKAEVSHIINIYNIKPKTYTIPSYQLSRTTEG